MVRMGEFYGNKDIRLMEKNGIDDDALRVGGCASTRTGDGEDQSRSDQMGEIIQDIPHVWVLHQM